MKHKRKSKFTSFFSKKVILVLLITAVITITFGTVAGKYIRHTSAQARIASLLEQPQTLTLGQWDEVESWVRTHGNAHETARILEDNWDKFTLDTQDNLLVQSTYAHVRANMPLSSTLQQLILTQLDIHATNPETANEAYFKEASMLLLHALLRTQNPAEPSKTLIDCLTRWTTPILTDCSHATGGAWIYALGTPTIPLPHTDLILAPYWQRLRSIDDAEFAKVQILLLSGHGWDTRWIPEDIQHKHYLSLALNGAEGASTQLWQNRNVYTTEALARAIAAQLNAPTAKARLEAMQFCSWAAHNQLAGPWHTLLATTAMQSADDITSSLAFKPQVSYATNEDGTQREILTPISDHKQHQIADELLWHAWTHIGLLKTFEGTWPESIATNMRFGPAEACLWAMVQIAPERAFAEANHLLGNAAFNPIAIATLAHLGTDATRPILHDVLTSNNYTALEKMRAACLFPNPLSEEDRATLRQCAKQALRTNDTPTANAALWRLGEPTDIPFISDIADSLQAALASVEGTPAKTLPNTDGLPPITSDTNPWLRFALVRAINDQTYAQKQLDYFANLGCTGTYANYFALLAATHLSTTDRDRMALDLLDSVEGSDDESWNKRLMGYLLIGYGNARPMRPTVAKEHSNTLDNIPYAEGIGLFLYHHPEYTFDAIYDMTDAQRAELNIYRVDALVDNGLRYNNERRENSFIQLAQSLRDFDTPGNLNNYTTLPDVSPIHAAFLWLKHDPAVTLDLLFNQSQIDHPDLDPYTSLVVNRWWHVLQDHMPENAPTLNLWIDQNYQAVQILRMQLWWKMQRPPADENTSASS